MKHCNKCDTDKPLADFSRRGEKYQAWCKACNKEHKKSWIASNRDKVQVNTLWSKYRLRPEDVQRMLEQQNGTCALCDYSFTGLSDMRMDHDHSCCAGSISCGKCVRGILCQKHNLMMIWVDVFKENPELLDRARKYGAVD